MSPDNDPLPNDLRARLNRWRKVPPPVARPDVPKVAEFGQIEPGLLEEDGLTTEEEAQAFAGLMMAFDQVFAKVSGQKTFLPAPSSTVFVLPYDDCEFQHFAIISPDKILAYRTRQRGLISATRLMGIESMLKNVAAGRILFDQILGILGAEQELPESLIASAKRGNNSVDFSIGCVLWVMIRRANQIVPGTAVESQVGKLIARTKDNLYNLTQALNLAAGGEG